MEESYYVDARWRQESNCGDRYRTQGEAEPEDDGWEELSLPKDRQALSQSRYVDTFCHSDEEGDDGVEGSWYNLTDARTKAAKQAEADGQNATLKERSRLMLETLYIHLNNTGKTAANYKQVNEAYNAALRTYTESERSTNVNWTDCHTYCGSLISPLIPDGVWKYRIDKEVMKLDDYKTRVSKSRGPCADYVQACVDLQRLDERCEAVEESGDWVGEFMYIASEVESAMKPLVR